MKLTINKLIKEAIKFCKQESNITHDELIGITDGKAVGTYIEHKFEEYLKNKYDVTIGSSAKGIDLPDRHINTDIKVTSIKKPQSSSSFKSIEQKIYGLGYNLLIFIYEKTDINNNCYLDFKHCMFLESERSGDYNLTKILRKMIELGAKEADIIEILKDNDIPGDEEALKILAQRIMKNPPKQGYLTISNAFQWRLRYINAINLEDEINGVYTYEEYNGKEYDEYQTPLFFTDEICNYLKNELEINPDIIIEPTCGIGNFIKSASKTFPKSQIYGIDIDKEKLNKIDSTIPNIKLINENILTLKFNHFDKKNSFLIIGNPPYFTKNKLSKINAKNKTDLKVLTNNENIDISEYILLNIIDEFKNTKTTLAFLCKTKISRNVFIKLVRNKIEYSFIKQININSRKIYKIKEDTCLFIIQFGGKILTDKTCKVSEISNPSKLLYEFGFVEDKFYSNIDDIPPIDGKCELEWRHGVKHDCAKIMEFTLENNQLINKNYEPVNIEKTLIYPLLKSGQLKKPIVNETSKYVLITQNKIKQDTNYIKTEAPKTWKYLKDNKEYFDKRKSSSYTNTPEFSIFGIGDYSFKKYKVAIAGFCKNPIFSLVTGDKTFMLDDSCYFLSFDDYDTAYITMLILNSELVKKFLNHTAILDSKRPFSKKLLKRIDISKCLELLSYNDLKITEENLELKAYINEDKFNSYKKQFE